MRDQEGSDVKAIYFYIKTYSSGWWMRKEKKEEKKQPQPQILRHPAVIILPCYFRNGAQHSAEKLLLASTSVYLKIMMNSFKQQTTIKIKVKCYYFSCTVCGFSFLSHTKHPNWRPVFFLYPASLEGYIQWSTVKENMALLSTDGQSKQALVWQYWVKGMWLI